MPNNNQLNIAGEESSGPGEIYYDQPSDDTLLVGLRGNWKIGKKLPAAREIQKQINSHHTIRRIAFDTRQLTAWDSSLLTFLIKIVAQSQKDKIEIDEEGLPKGVVSLLHLAAAVPERKGARKEAARVPLLERIGAYALNTGNALVEIAEFASWAGPLPENFSRVLAENLSLWLNTKKVAIFPGTKLTFYDYSIGVNVTRFDGRPGGKAHLRARWVILDKKRKNMLFQEHTVLSHPIENDSIEAMIASQSRTVVDFSREIAEAIKKLVEEKTASE